MPIDTTLLRALRAGCIALLNALDDALGLPRTVRTRAERRRGLTGGGENNESQSNNAMAGRCGDRA